MPNVGLRDYFQANGYNVNYDPSNQNITVLNPKNNQYKTLAPGSYNNNNGTAQMDLGTAQGLFSQPKPSVNYQDMYQNYLNTALSNDFSNAQSLANNQAARQANEKRSGYQSQLNLLNTNRDTSIRGVDTNLTNNKQDLEDNSFQKYLASRQAVANSGVSGTGLAEDQNTRLALNKDREMAKILNNADQQRYAIQNAYNTQSQDIQQQMNNVNESQLANELYQQYRQQQLQENAAKAQAMYQGMNWLSSQDQNQWERDYKTDVTNWNKYNDITNREDKNNQWNQEFGLRQDHENTQKDQWNKEFGLKQSETDWEHAYKDKAFNADQAYKSASLAQRAASAASKTKAPTTNDFTAYFAKQFSSGDVPLYAVEDQIRANADGLMSQGIDPNKMIDAAYKAFYDGKFSGKKALEDYVNNKKKVWDKTNEDRLDNEKLYGPPLL